MMTSLADLNRLMVKHTIGDSGVEPISQVAPQAGASTDADVLADLQRTSDGFTVAISDSEDMHLSHSEVRRSSLLSTLYDVSGIGDVVPLGLSARLLREWHAAVSGSRGGAGCDVSLPSLARILEAADFIGDQDAVHRSSLSLMRLAFQADASGTSPGVSPNGQCGALRFSAGEEPSQGGCAAKLQVLETLPEHLAVLTLRAAISATRPDVQCSPNRAACLSPEDMPPARRRQAALLAIMALLPRHLHHLVIRAHTPAAADHRALALPLPQLQQAAPIIRAVAAAPGAQLTSLALINCSWEGAVYGGYAQLERTADCAAESHVFAPLAALTELVDLRVEFAVSGRGVDGAAFVAAFGDVLQRLPQLLSLRVRAWSRRGLAVQQLALRLPALRMLRALDLSHNGLKPLLSLDAPLSILAPVLRLLTMLTHLCLAHNRIGAKGWEALAPAVTALPLLSLDLEKCELGDEFSLRAPCRIAALAGTPIRFRQVGQPRPSTELRCLRLSRNPFKDSRLQFLTLMPRLTELSLTRTRLTVDARQQILQLMHAPDLKVLEIGVFISNLQGTTSPALAAESLGAALAGCLERHPQLRRLAVGCEDASVLVHALQPLSTLPELREVDLVYAEFHRVGQPRTVAELLSHATQLTSLEMLRLFIKPPVMRPFLHAIGSLEHLQRLELGTYFYGTPVTAACVARGLGPLTRLTRLRLEGCRLASVAAVALAKALSGMPGMHELVLCSEMRATSVHTVAEALPALRMLSLFVLETTKLGKNGVAAVARSLRKMRGLRVLRLGCGTYSEECKQRLVQAAPPGLEHILFMP